MSLLELDRVCKRYGPHGRQRVILNQVTLALDPGELVGIWGRRGAGKSTLMRVAAGVEPPDDGTIRFGGQTLGAVPAGSIAGGVAYCRMSFRWREGQTVFDQLLCRLEALGLRADSARSRAREALQLAGVEHCVSARPNELDGGERVRACIARALASRPTLVVIDEPDLGVALLERDAILALLRDLADSGLAVLMSTGDATCLAGTQRALSLGDGVLRGELAPGIAEVLPLHAGSRPAA